MESLKHLRNLLFLFFLSFIIPGSWLTAQAPTTADTTKKTAPKPSLVDKVKGAKKYEGLFTFFQDTTTGSLQLFIRKDQLGKEFIYQSFSINGPTQYSLNQSMHRSNFVFKINKSFDKLEFARINTNFYYNPNNAISKTKGVDVPEAVFHADKIAFQNDSGYLINADPIFLSEKMDPVKPVFLPGTPPTAFLNMGNLNSAKSKYHKLRSFPENSDVLVDLAYENPFPLNGGGKDITDPRYIRVTMQHSFIAIPDNDFRARADHRHIGYFSRLVDDLTDPSDKPFKDIIVRWHLVKKDPTAAISEPVTPITFWLENTTPVEYRQTIIDAGLQWNKAFEQAGFKNAVQMKIMPDDATWDPDDLRYNVIRWVSSSAPPYAAIGPNFVNPKNGQILGADITFELSAINSSFYTRSLFEKMTGAEAAEASFYLPGITHLQEHQCDIAALGSEQTNFAKAVFGTMDAGEKTNFTTQQKQLLTWMVMHEMGHTLGLTHNMKASQLHSLNDLHNKSLTQREGLMGSVMDYPDVNIAATPAQQGDFYTQTVGPYDKWVIEYGYKPLSPNEEETALKNIAARANTDKRLLFGNDADDMRTPGKASDPRIMTFDMSNDAIGFAEQRLKLLNELIPKLKNKFATEGNSYNTLRAMYNVINNQRFAQADIISRYVGGLYIDRKDVGAAPDARPFTPQTLAEQKRALQLLDKYVFNPNAFSADAPLYPYLQQDRRGFNFFTNTEDPKPTNFQLNIQTYILSHLLHPATTQRINHMMLYGGTLSITDLFKELQNMVFAKDLSTNVNLTRQNLQVEYAKTLIAILEGRRNHDNTTKSASLAALKNIRSLLVAAKSVDTQTKAHREHVVQLIDEALKKD